MSGPKQKDFYLNDRGLAAYLEKDWFDHILKSDPYKPEFAFAPFDPMNLYSPYHEKMIDFLAQALDKSGVKPLGFLEIGSSLGRTYYEICRKIKSVETATLVEPSKNLYSAFERIFSGDEIVGFSILKGIVDTAEIQIHTTPIRAACSGVRLSSIPTAFQKLDANLGKFSLVVCSNVIDQCADHIELAEFLKKSTSLGGVLLLSCTYQWNDKYIGNSPVMIKDINELFDSRWRFLGETNLPFQVRVNERHWMGFLSHTVAYQLTAEI